ncbi:MAG TPA: ABC transporter substrate-binding protein [Gammaproteobacteria bacterium]
MMPRIALFAALAAAALAAAPGRAQEPAAATPEAVVERLHEGLVEVAGAHGDEPVEVRYEALLPIVTATHDLPYIAELTIRREWPELTDEQRQRFVDAFVRLSVMTYASRFGSLEEGMFELGESRPPADGRAVVTATLTTRDGDEIPFEYVLHEADGGWKIINILADNVSDLALKRAEYRRLLSSGTIDDVIAELERQADEAAR